MADDLSPAILAQCRIIEDHHDRTIDYAHLGALRRQVQQWPDNIAAAWKSYADTVGRLQAPDSSFRAELRILWLMINDEQKARRDAAYNARRLRLKHTKLTIGARCERIHQQIDIRMFLERECGIPVRGNRCRCPIHDGDSDSSFSLWREGNGATCFVCHFKGDVIQLAQQYWHLGRPVEAIRRLERWL